MKFFVLLNIIFIILFIYWLSKDKKKLNPSKLNFNRKKPIDSGTFDSILRDKSENNDQYEKVLNILFQYNGETWDAYEVLGLPAGSSAEDARAAFSNMCPIRKDDTGFLRAALDAIISVKSQK